MNLPKLTLLKSAVKSFSPHFAIAMPRSINPGKSSFTFIHQFLQLRYRSNISSSVSNQLKLRTYLFIQLGILTGSCSTVRTTWVGNFDNNQFAIQISKFNCTLTKSAFNLVQSYCRLLWSLLGGCCRGLNNCGLSTGCLGAYFYYSSAD